MAIPAPFAELVGNWEGINRLWRIWISPDASESPSAAQVTSEAGGTALAIRYTWSLEGQPQEGLMLLTGDPGTGKAVISWSDSWHSSQTLLNSEGEIDADGRLTVLASYGDDPAALWHWRTEVLGNADSFEILMYNITDQGEEMLAVHSTYRRIADG